MTYISPKRLYLTVDKEVVEEGDERAAVLLVGEGGQLTDERAAQYGLTGKAEATPQGDAPKSDVSAPESKAQRAAESKAVKAPEANK